MHSDSPQSQQSTSASPRPPADPFSSAGVEAGARAATLALLSSVLRDTDAVSSAVERTFADAKVHLLTRDRASWVLHVPRWHRAVYSAIGAHALLPADADLQGEDAYARWFERVWELHPERPGTIKMYGRDVLTPRFQQAYDVAMRFSGGTFAAEPLPCALQQSAKAMQAMVVDPQDATRSFLRGALVNWYADGEHYIGPHDDADKRFLPDSPVLSLSLGAARKFVFSAKRSTKRKRQQEGGGGEAAGGGGSGDASGGVVQRLELLLQDGDLVVMGGTTQQTHKHALPKMKRCLERRVSVTMRCFRD